MDELAKHIARKRKDALNAYYASDRRDMKAFGQAVALLDINHWLDAHGMDVYGGESGEALDRLTQDE